MLSPLSSRQRRIAGVVASALAAVLLVGLILQVSGVTGSGPRTAGGEPKAKVATPSDQRMQETYDELAELARRDPADPFAVGRADAPVVMIEYADFQCPFCRKFAEDTKPDLVERYVEEGVLRIEWRQYPVFGEESMTAAKAAYAAGRQDRFWEFHDTLFANAPAKERMNSGAFTADRLVELAGESGVEDLKRFRADMESDAAEEAVARDMREGQGIGVTSTPAFLVNGRPVLGARPTGEFVQMIEQARRQAGAGEQSGSGSAR